jgi:hypothetical protein
VAIKALSDGQFRVTMSEVSPENCFVESDEKRAQLNRNICNALEDFTDCRLFQIAFKKNVNRDRLIARACNLFQFNDPL